MQSPLRILHLEDDPKDAELLQAMLEAEGILCHVIRVETQADFFAALEQGGFDLILADYTLPSFDGLSALKITLEKCPDVPFIFVSGTLGEEVAIEAFKIGATDYVLKERLSRIAPAVHRALREAKERTERKRAEEALWRSEAYLAEAQRLSHTGSWAFNVGTRQIVHWSQEHFRIFGLDPEQGMPSFDTFRQRIHPDDHARAAALLEGAVREGTDYALECRIVLPDGAMKYIHAVGHPVFNASGAPVEFVGTVMDVTERKRAEEALRASEASLAEGQQISQTGSWRWHVRTGELRGSAEHARIFGFDPAAGQRSHLRYRERVHPDDRPALVHLLNRAIRDQRAFQHEYRIVLPDGVVKHVQLAGRPDTDASGDLEFVGTIMDVTERRRAEEALRTAQAELARVARLTTMGELTASIAHEINQPLGAVVNNASACVRWLAAHNLEEARHSALRVVADGHRAGEIIARIRALAKKAPPHKDWLDLNATIRDVLALARSEVHRHGVVLETHLAEEVPRILGDRIQLQQVLLNLVMNAIEAMSGGGAGPRALWVSSEPVAATAVVIAVRDSGPGFEPQSLDRLCDAFYTTKPHGLGLGLAISRRIIEAHGGRLWATAQVPHGAVVQFTVPIGSEGGA